MKSIVVKEKSGIVVGNPDVDPEAPSHVAGVHQGNRPKKNQDDQKGPRRSTGISPDDHGPIDPRMPKLTPP